MYKLNAFLGFIPLIIAFSYFFKMPISSKLLIASIAISIITEATCMIMKHYSDIYYLFIPNIYSIIFFILTGLAYFLKVRDTSPKLGAIFLILSGALILLHIGIHIKFGINTLQALTYMSFCVYCIMFSLFYFYYVVIISEEIDLLKDSFFLLTAGFFIFYMVSTIVHYSNNLFTNEDTDMLYEFKHFIYSFYLIIITIAFLIDRNKLGQLQPINENPYLN